MKQKLKDIEIAIALEAFKQGFCWGADPTHARRRHVVDPDTHKYWRYGFDQGQAAAKEAARQYQAALEFQNTEPNFGASVAAKTIETAEDERIQRQLKMLAEHPPTNHLLYPLEENDECPNCHLGTVEQVKGMEDVYVCRGECGAFFRGPEERS